MAATTMLPHRKLGSDGPEVSAIGLGCMSLSGVYGANDDAATPDFIRAAIDRGSISSTAPTSMAGATTRNCWAAR
ncbi:MAG: hypothetical protein V7632_605 [Bradyrhizobium sp.]|jgi:predicted aldo/keto reductase-like oxidoreductase